MLTLRLNYKHPLHSMVHTVKETSNATVSVWFNAR